MPYSVNNTDSSLNFTVQDGAVDNSTLAISLIGTNAENYADDIARNDVHLLENFASTSAPVSGTVLTGQLWYDKTDNVLKVYKGTSAGWVNLEPLVVGTAPVRLTPKIGEQYFDTSNDKMYLYNGANWLPTGYGGEVTSALSGDSLVNNPTKFGAKVRAIFLKDTSGRSHPCMALVHVNNSTTNELYGGSTNGESIMAIFNHDATFTADNVVSNTEGDNINYFAELNATGGVGVTINKGMNLRKDYVAEAVSLATEAITAQKANALFVGGTTIINAEQFFRNNTDLLPDVDISFSIGSPTKRYDHLFVQQITLGAGQEQLQFVSNGSAKIGSVSNQAGTVYAYDLYGGNAAISDVLTVGGATTIGGNTEITGTATLQVNNDIRSNATIFAQTLTDNQLQINSGSISSAVNGTFSGTVTFGTLSDGVISITQFDNDHNMAANSNVRVSTQQGTKTYVDTEIATLKAYVEAEDKAQDLDFSGDTGTGTVLIGNTTVDTQSMTFIGGDGITTTGNAQTLTTDVDSTVVRTSGAQTIGGVKTFTDNANFHGNVNLGNALTDTVVIAGNLTVQGTQTTVNSATLSVADNEITLNSDVTGTPSENAGIEVERGGSTNTRIRWNEGTDHWEITNDGTNYTKIAQDTGELAEGTNLYYTDARADLRVQAAIDTDTAFGNASNTLIPSQLAVKTYVDAQVDTKDALSELSGDSDDVTEGTTNIYFTNARADARIGLASASSLTDVTYSSPNDGQVLMWDNGNSTWTANSIPGGISTLVNLTDVAGGSSANAGQVLQKLANGNFGFGSVSTANYYLDGLSFDTTSGILTASVFGTTNQTVDLDGRYAVSGTEDTGVPAILGTGGTPTLNTGVTAEEVRTLIGAGTSSNNTTYTASSGIALTGTNFTNTAPDQTVSLTGTGATTVSGTYPNFTISSTNDGDTTYSAGTGLTAVGTEFRHTDTSSYAGTTASARTYITGISVDTFGHIQSVTTASETVTNTDTNYYLSSASFNTGDGILTLNRSGLTAVTVDLDGRYCQDTTANYGFYEIRGYNSNLGSGYVSQTSASAASGIMFFKAGNNITLSESTNFGGTGKDAMVITAANDNTTYSTATSSALGLVKIGYSENGKNYPVELSSGQMYVNVPWTDTNTQNTYSSSSFTVTDLSGYSSNNGTFLRRDGTFATPPNDNTTYSAGTGVSFSGTQINIGQAVGTSSTVQFGLVRSTGDVVAYYSSDERLKDNVKPIENALEKLQKIRGVEFDWNDKQDVYEGHDTGVIAQEVQKVLPEVVTEREDGMLAVKYEKMVGLLIESIKDLKAEVDDLKRQLNEK
jgi:hypothetical protein